MQQITNISSTAYDDAYRTMLEKCSEFLIPVLRELFGEPFTGNERVMLSQNELFITGADGSTVERVTDSSFLVSGRNADKRYHIECQSSPDKSILIRLFEYDSQIALDGSVLEGERLIVEFPRTALIYLRSNADTPDEMTVEVKAPDGQSVIYGVPVLKTQRYSLEELFEKNLFFLLPFYSFCYEKELPQIDRDEKKRKKLADVYRGMRIRLDELCETKQINEYQKYEVIHAARLVMDKLMVKYPKTRKEVYEVMGGKVIESEADRILQRGMEKGMRQGVEQGMRQGVEQGIRQGVQQGVQQGVKQGIRQMIEKMLRNDKTPEQIAEFCGYELEEVLAVQEELLQKA